MSAAVGGSKVTQIRAGTRLSITTAEPASAASLWCRLRELGLEADRVRELPAADDNTGDGCVATDGADYP